MISNCEISGPNSDVILEHCIWEDYRLKESYKNCIVKNSDYYLSGTTKYSLNDLKNAIKHFCEIDKSEDNKYSWHIEKMEENYEKMKSNTLSTEEKKGCALVLSYYTGYKVNSDRSSRNSNALIKGKNSYNNSEDWSNGEEYYSIIYYLTKAISNLPFHWGYTIRYVQLTQEQLTFTNLE